VYLNDCSCPRRFFPLSVRGYSPSHVHRIFVILEITVGAVSVILGLLILVNGLGEILWL
jgi:hypothetical protein